jgi:ribosomal protein S18 acetylase RimI-like enzyme
MSITLHKALPADRERVDELFREMLRSIFPDRESRGYEEGYLDKFFGPSEDWICLARDGEKTVAYLSVEVYRAPEAYIYLDDLSVTAEYRNRGVGTALLREAEACSRRIGVPRIIFHVEKTNRGARRLYERLGYRILRDDGSRWLMGREVTPEEARG